MKTLLAGLVTVVIGGVSYFIWDMTQIQVPNPPINQPPAPYTDPSGKVHPDWKTIFIVSWGTDGNGNITWTSHP